MRKLDLVITAAVVFLAQNGPALACHNQGKGKDEIGCTAVQVPEIDVTSGAAAAAVLIGVCLVMLEMFRRRRASRVVS
jgi:hypothetical protein